MPETSAGERDSHGGLAVHASRFLGAVFVTFLLLAACWVVEIVNYSDDGRLNVRYGIRAHDTGGLWHIFTAPFLHSGLDHIIANSVPLAVLGFLAALRGVPRFVVVSVIITMASGFGVWFLSAPGTVTVGASGLIFGYFAYLPARGLIERRPLDIIVGVLVALFYGTIIVGALPGHPGISWQAHMFGLVGGVIAAWFTRQRTAA